MNRSWTGKRYWIVGASEGLGRSLAEAISRVGAEVVVSARNKDRLDELVASLPGRASAVTVDVTSRDSVTAAAQEVGRIDGLVYLAGVYWPMHASEWKAEEAEAMIDVNLTGAIRTVGAVLPEFIAEGRGHVVLTGSLSAFRGLPGAIGYGASKAGVLSLAESMQADLQGTGVTVQVVNPGFVRTRLTDKNDFHMPMIMDPEDAARQIFEHMNGDSFKKSFPFPLSTLLRASQFLPDWLYYALFSKSR